MTYSPGGPGGYQPPQPPSYGAPTSGSFAAQGQAPAAAGESQLPFYLKIAVAALGVLAYLASFGPTLVYSSESLGSSKGTDMWLVLFALIAALVAGVSLLPKARDTAAPVAVLSLTAVFMVISEVVNKSDLYSYGWAIWIVLLLVIAQAAAAVMVLLYSAGVLTPPVPQPRQPEPSQYGSYGAPAPGYYGQQPGAEQRPGYPSQYGGYTPPPAPGSLGAPGQQPQQPPQPPQGGQHGTPTPPTGFPSFSPPPAVGSGESAAAPTTQIQPGQPYQPGQQPEQPSGPGQPPTA